MKIINCLILLGSLAAFSPVIAGADEPGQDTTNVVRNVLPGTDSASGSSIGIERASGEKLATAIGHYARARSLLIAAVGEFDKGLKLANPDAVLDSKEWRITLVNRAEELEKVIDPQPRVSKGGVKFSADSRLLDGANK